MANIIGLTGKGISYIDLKIDQKILELEMENEVNTEVIAELYEDKDFRNALKDAKRKELLRKYEDEVTL